MAHLDLHEAALLQVLLQLEGQGQG